MALQAVPDLYAPKRGRPFKLDLGSGQRVREGYQGVDIADGADFVVDLFAFPWPFASNSTSHVHISHFAEHIPHDRPEYGRVDGWWLFWDEVHRICRPGATVEVVHPYVKSERAFWDPTHVRFIHELTWYYLDLNWRKAQGLDHYQTSADFEVVVISGLGLADDIVARSQEHQAFARAHYWNVIPDLSVQLKARK